MDQNEMMNQLANNPQMLAQLVQTMQQNGMIPNNNPMQRQPMNWNVPTNPMAAMWLANMFGNANNMNNNNRNGQQMAQNQNQATQNQVQSQEQKPDENILPIRVVKSPDDIKVYQIPMDDKISLFLQDDLSVIYGKKWTNDGDIKNMRFVRVDGEEAKTPSGEATSNPGFNVNELMANIATLIDSKLEQFKKDYRLDVSQPQNKTNRNNNRKVGEADNE